MSNFENETLDIILEHFYRLTGLSEKDFEVLNSHKDKLSEWIDEVVKDFYDTLFSYEPTAKMFREDERPKVEKMLRDWYLGLLESSKEHSFWAHQWFIGLVHISRDVKNVYMHGMMSRIQNLFCEKCFQTFPPEEAKEVFLSFKKITDAIASVIAEGYMDQYIEAIARMSGIKRPVIERMAKLESKNMIEEYREKLG